MGGSHSSQRGRYQFDSELWARPRSPLSKALCLWQRGFEQVGHLALTQSLHVGEPNLHSPGRGPVKDFPWPSRASARGGRRRAETGRGLAIFATVVASLDKCFLAL